MSNFIPCERTFLPHSVCPPSGRTAVKGHFHPTLSVYPLATPLCKQFEAALHSRSLVIHKIEGGQFRDCVFGVGHIEFWGLGWYWTGVVLLGYMDPAGVSGNDGVGPTRKRGRPPIAVTEEILERRRLARQRYNARRTKREGPSRERGRPKAVMDEAVLGLIDGDTEPTRTDEDPGEGGAGNKDPGSTNGGGTNQESRRMHINMIYVGSQIIVNARVCAFKVESETILNIGRQEEVCGFCKAHVWPSEFTGRHVGTGPKGYSICCGKGKVQLPLLRETPPELNDLISADGTRSNVYFSKSRIYNNIFAFCSFGGNVDHSVNNGKGPYVFRVCGRTYHSIGSLVPPDGLTPKFAQLYMYDGQEAVEHRLSFPGKEGEVDPTIVSMLQEMLERENALVGIFKQARERFTCTQPEHVNLRLFERRTSDGRFQNVPTANDYEFAGLVVDNDFANRRDIVAEHKRNGLQHISELHPSFMSLQYPLLFPFGEDGYRINIKHRNANNSKSEKDTVSMRQYYAFRAQYRVAEGHALLLGGRLFLQFIVDAWCSVERMRLIWVQRHQSIIRSDLYNNIVDSLRCGDVDATEVGRRVILPSSFTGGYRYMQQNFQDSLAVCKEYGHPVGSQLVYTVEFQKRGLPHAHIVLWLAVADKLLTPEDIDNVISAEIPDKEADPKGYKAVSQLMMHGPCGPANPKCPCMSNGRCTKLYPKSFSEKTVVDVDGHVVPYHRGLLVKYQGHINVEWCNRSLSIKYLFKYIGKGPDTATARLENANQNLSSRSESSPTLTTSSSDEVSNYLSCRYVSAAESCWRLFEFPIHHREPFVQRLYFHLENEQEVRFHDNDTLPEVVRRVDPDGTMFIQWMLSNRHDNLGHDLTFIKYPTKFRWDASAKRWFRRKQKIDVIGRMVYAHPASGERFYMRLLLNIVVGVKTFEEIRKVDGIVYSTYKEACFHRGLLESDKEWHIALTDASLCASASQLRDLFVTLLVFCEVSNPSELWGSHWENMADDIEYKRRKITNFPNLKITNVDKEMMTLEAVNELLKQYGKRLADYPGLPELNIVCTSKYKNELLLEEMMYDRDQLQFKANEAIHCLNQIQRIIFDQIVESVEKDIGGFYFVYGPGGTGKTFLWSTIIARLRGEGKIVLAVASSGIASLLIEGGRTAHSRFKIPIDANEFTCCEIKQNTYLAELICNTSLVIWDEALMTNRFVFEAVDRTFRDIRSKVQEDSRALPFGGLTMLLGGGFQGNKVPFRDWVLAVGDGSLETIALGDDLEPSWIRLPEEIRVECSGDPIEAIVNEIYRDLHHMHGDLEYLRNRAILAPLNEHVENVNMIVLQRLPGEFKEYKSYDTICKGSSTSVTDEALYPPEYLNSLKFSGMPNHELKIKIGAPIMLLRNLNAKKGLCNGTRLIITRCYPFLIEAIIITGKRIGELTYIPRITMCPADKTLPFVLKRKQFPISVCYAMTVNKSQGQTVQNVGLYLQNPVFGHGQMYVAVSRVTSPIGLKIVTVDDDHSHNGLTKNIVYHEIFDNLM
ncbi:uncharacterized protein LOC141702627 [Apium graveolens]|uniref:uncharacterized protein LOC141702627 n=1 Tax=Apium graveolens TaxID=4045 RepID=UPI003D7B3010